MKTISIEYHCGAMKIEPSVMVYNSDSYISFAMKTQYVYIPSLQREVVYYIGHTAEDNFAVIDQMQSREDLWFHAGSGISSCHVVCVLADIAPLDKKIRRQIITQGALLCKKHTAKLRCLANVDIQYAPLYQVQKTAVAGKVILQNMSAIKQIVV